VTGRESVPTTLEQFRQHVIRELEKQSYRFSHPNHDWLSLQLWAQNEDGVDYADVAKVVEIVRGGGDFTTADEKDEASAAVRAAIAGSGSYRYALVTNGNLVDKDVTYEVLTMAVGDAEEEQLWIARIRRDSRRRRRIGVWKLETEWEGRFVQLNDLLRAPRTVK
jgi:hypothetical protein